MSDKILVQAIEDNGGGLYVAYIANDVCTALFCGFEHVPESIMLRELENAYMHGVADWENPLQGDYELHYNDLITSEAGSAHIIGQMDSEGFTDWPERMGGNGTQWADLKERATFKVIFYQNGACLPAKILAESINGTVISSAANFNGLHDLAIIEAPNDGATIERFRTLADNDENVLLYDIN